MSDIFLDRELLETLRHERAPEPAKRWRNKWRSNIGPGDFYRTCPWCGENNALLVVRRGDIVWSCCEFPSKDVAETFAQVVVEINVERGFEPDDYLGAFPVEEGE